jgi:transcriptional regulator with XRE-family HTH domain
VFRNWRAGETCIAYHPRLHRDLATATVVEDFMEGPRRYYVKIRFHDDPTEIVLTHKQNVYGVADATRLDLNIDLERVSSSAAEDVAEPGTIVGRLVHGVRTAERMSIRELARRSGLSPAQLSRLEASEVGRPSVETIVAIAHALSRHPVPLLIAARAVKGEDARTQLLELLRTAQDGQASWDANGFSERIADPAVAPQTIATLAGELFTVAGGGQTIGEPYQQVHGSGTVSPELDSILAFWDDLTVERRGKILDFATDQRILSRLDRQAASATANNAA